MTSNFVLSHQNLEINQPDEIMAQVNAVWNETIVKFPYRD